MYFYWTLPSRILPYSKVVKGERNGKGKCIFIGHCRAESYFIQRYGKKNEFTKQYARSSPIRSCTKKPSASNLNIENKKQTAFVKKIGARCAYWCEALDVQGTLKVEITAQRADEEKGLLKLRAVIFFRDE